MLSQISYERHFYFVLHLHFKYIEWRNKYWNGNKFSYIHNRYDNVIKHDDVRNALLSNVIFGSRHRTRPVRLFLLLFTFIRAVTREDICCDGGNLVSCARITVNPQLLTNRREIRILGTVLYFSNRVEPHGYVYKNRWLDEAVLSYNKKTDSLFGSFHIQGRAYEIEACRDGHVLKQRNQETIMNDVVVPSLPGNLIPKSPSLYWAARSWGARDQTTIVTFTVKFYYNEVFAQSTPDIEGWVDSSLAMLNQAMVNSLVPVRVRKFATEMAMIPEFRNWS